MGGRTSDPARRTRGARRAGPARTGRCARARSRTGGSRSLRRGLPGSTSTSRPSGRRYAVPTTVPRPVARLGFDGCCSGALGSVTAGGAVLVLLPGAAPPRVVVRPRPATRNAAASTMPRSIRAGKATVARVATSPALRRALRRKGRAHRARERPQRRWIRGASRHGPVVERRAAATRPRPGGNDQHPQREPRGIQCASALRT